MNHLVSDSIIRIKNAALARRKQAELPYSKLVKAIAEVLVKEGFLKQVKDDEVDGKKVLQAVIAYSSRSPVLTDISVVSKPSLRMYATTGLIRKRQQKGKHTFVVTTSKGVMTGREAMKLGIGGELLFEVW